MEAVEVVLGDRSGQGTNSANTVLDLLTNLVDKSLVVVHHGQETRYRMLETIREYAREKLLASGEVGRIRARHLAYYLQLAEEAEVRLRGADQVNWFGRLELEQDNCRAALDWSLESEAIEEGSRLAGALGLFWNQRGYLSEGSEWLERFLAEARLDDLIRAKALLRAAHLAWQQNNHEQALAQVEQSLALCRRHGDKRGIARSLHLSGVLAHWMGDRDQGGNLLEESLSLSREISDDLSVIDTLLFLGDIRLRQGDNELAAVMIQESLALSRKLSDQWGIAFAISSLGEIARRDGDYEQAVSYFQKALDIAQEQSFRVEMPFQLEALAMTVAEQGHSKLAAHLWGAAEALREAIHSPLPPSYHAEYAPYKDAIRGALGEEALTSAWDEGQALSTDQVIALAMSAPAAETPPPTASADRPPFGLTPREVEVLGLVSTGLTDAQVAEELFISPRTVSKHLQSIYSKLDLSSRSAATRFAIEHNLL
jgi:DNA-binding CsgD family transcriptional regulator/tetratricopeptide (TPR) repeat protein